MSTPTDPIALQDRLFPPHLPAAMVEEYLAHYLPYIRGPLIMLAPAGTFAALTLYALSPEVGSALAELTAPVAATLLALQAASWLWMLLARRMAWFSRACLGFLVSFYLLVAWLTQGQLPLLIWMIPQFLVWQLAIAPLALRASTFVASLAITIAVPVLLLWQAGAGPGIWAILLLHLVGIGMVATILFRASNRIRRENFLATQQMRQAAFSDSLTGMLTRRRFFDLAGSSLEQALDMGWPVCACFIDLDDFKRINDQRGHAVGDRVLSSAAQCFEGLAESVTRTQHGAPRPHVVVGRMGGEEFAMLLAGYPLAQAREVAERLLERVRSIEIDQAHVTASAGIAQAVPGETLGALLHRADMALLQAKRAGKNQVVEAGPDPVGGDQTRLHVRPG